MNSNYTSVVGLAIGMLLISGPTFSQTTIQGCSPNTLSLCVNDPGVSLPDDNQYIVGVGTPGATSCSVHVRQTRTISSTCDGVILYGIALVIDTVKYFIQPITEISVDSSGQATLVFDTRTAEDAWIRNSGIPYNPDCGDEYTIEWYVSDECGDEDYCEELLQLYDCHLPEVSVWASPQVIQIPVGCQLTVFAYDFVLAALDDCLAENELLYSLSDTAYIPFQPLDYCALGLGIETSFPIWAADQGRDLNCNDTIEWQERNLVRRDIPVVITEPGNCECFDPESYVSGKVTTPINNPISMVEVNMTSTGIVFPTQITGGDGEYLFNNVPVAIDVTITAYRNDNHRNGVSTLDLVKIQKYLLGIDTITNPYTILAMDANNSQNVSAIDMIELRKLILGIYDELPNQRSWRFIDKKYVFPTPTAPWPYPASITLSVNQPVEDADFIGIKIGDVNNTVQANFNNILPRTNLPKKVFQVADQSFKRDQVLEIPVYAADIENLLGFQLTWSAQGLIFEEIRPNTLSITEGEYALMGDQLTMSWLSTEAIQLAPNEPLFTIIARASNAGNLKSALQITSAITSAEVYDRTDVTYQPVLEINSAHPVAFELVPASPNPFSDQAVLPYYLQRTGTVTMTVSTTDGVMLQSKTMEGKVGRNEFVLQADQIAASGMLIVSMHAGGEVQFQKMMLVK